MSGLGSRSRWTISYCQRAAKPDCQFPMGIQPRGRNELNAWWCAGWSSSTKGYYPTVRMMQESLSSWGMRSPMPWLTTATSAWASGHSYNTGRPLPPKSLVTIKVALRKAILAAAIGMGTNVGITLPFSRKHEYEADHLGRIFMAMAGYDPNEAVAFLDPYKRRINRQTARIPIHSPCRHKTDCQTKEGHLGSVEMQEKLK